MKNLFFVIFSLLLCINMPAQVLPEKANVFVRVFDLQEKKIAKGKILSITDSAIQLQGREELINFRNIGLIRTKRSAGHNMIVGAAAGVAIGGVMGIESADPDEWFGYTKGEGAVLGGVLGGGVGAGIGGLSILFKKSNSYIINGDPAKFKEFNSAMSGSDH